VLERHREYNRHRAQMTEEEIERERERRREYNRQRLAQMTDEDIERERAFDSRRDPEKRGGVEAYLRERLLTLPTRLLARRAYPNLMQPRKLQHRNIEADGADCNRQRPADM
jgi:hypothetical protein